MVLAALAVSLSVATAQTQQSDISGKSTVTVTIPFFVFDHGKSIAMPIELSVLDNKTPAPSVVSIHPAGELPLRLGILIDTSNSEGGAAYTYQEFKGYQIS